MNQNLPASDELKKQIAEERKLIEGAPRVAVGPSIGRCHFCGRMAQALHPIETLNGVTRYKGECCYRGENHVHRSAY